MKKYIFGALLSVVLFSCSDSDDEWKDDSDKTDAPSENVEYATDETVYHTEMVIVLVQL